MQMANTFLEAGWDFVNETANGIEDIWWIIEGQGYPRLWWERSNDDMLFIVVDDFERYVDIGNEGIFRVYHVWIDGFKNPSINGSSIVGHFESPIAEQNIVHGGRQSMPLYYNNSGPANYSEAKASIRYLDLDRDPKIGRDWTIGGVEILSLWFHGDLNNNPEPMYVALADYKGSMAEVYHNNPNATQADTWMEWRIDLQEFADQGVNLGNIHSITIGLGIRDNPQPGGAGIMYFDDIRLYRPERAP